MTVTIAGLGIKQINGDSGNMSGNPVSLTASTTAGMTVKFISSGSTSTLNVSDSNFNTTIGANAGSLLGGGANQNVAVGDYGLWKLVNGANNTCVGYRSGFSYTGGESQNVLLGHTGIVGDDSVIRIGGGGGTQIACFIDGISEVIQPIDLMGNNAYPISINSEGQCGIGPISTFATNPVNSQSSSLILGTAYHNNFLDANANPFDILLNVTLNITVASSATISLGVGNTSTPGQQVIYNSLSVPGVIVIPIYIPAGYYALLSTSGTITAAIVGQIALPI